jgi:hypothetical protein
VTPSVTTLLVTQLIDEKSLARTQARTRLGVAVPSALVLEKVNSDYVPTLPPLLYPQYFANLTDLDVQW